MNGAALQRFSIILLLFGGVLELGETAAAEYGLPVALFGLVVGVAGLSRELEDDP